VLWQPRPASAASSTTRATWAGFEPQQGFFAQHIVPRQLPNEAFQLGQARFIRINVPGAQKGPLGGVLMLVLPAAEQGRGELLLARHVRGRFTGLHRTDHWERELTSQAASLESQGQRRLAYSKEA